MAPHEGRFGALLYVTRIAMRSPSVDGNFFELIEACLHLVVFLLHSLSHSLYSPTRTRDIDTPTICAFVYEIYG